ncbi:MAG: hypothetical protein QF704_17545, partial [Anaerolineales bacterium]|nr:hypothetical protein [Anaerolineales bacterium]
MELNVNGDVVPIALYAKKENALSVTTARFTYSKIVVKKNVHKDYTIIRYSQQEVARRNANLGSMNTLCMKMK